jgi:hypothetical protein
MKCPVLQIWEFYRALKNPSMWIYQLLNTVLEQQMHSWISLLHLMKDQSIGSPRHSFIILCPPYAIKLLRNFQHSRILAPSGCVLHVTCDCRWFLVAVFISKQTHRNQNQVIIFHTCEIFSPVKPWNLSWHFNFCATLRFNTSKK